MTSSRVFAVAGVLCVALLVAAWFATPEAAVAQPGGAQQGGAAKPKCVGIATSVLRAENPVITRVYRIYDDGSVETYDDGAPGASWNKLGS